jgi:RHS repeat-associated protein
VFAPSFFNTFGPDGVFTWDCGTGALYRSVPPGVDDANDNKKCEEDPGDCQACGPAPGMPRWRVSEPYLSLWIQDEPVGYQPALGPRITCELAFKQYEQSAGYDTNVFGIGKKWNLSWLSYVTLDPFGNPVVHFGSGGTHAFTNSFDYLTENRLTGDTNTGFTVTAPDGSTNFFSLIVTNAGGTFLEAFLTASSNPSGQQTRFYYAAYTSAAPVIRLTAVVDGDGRTNSISYVSSNAYSTNLISQVTDPFGRYATLLYDSAGHLTNITDVIGISSSFIYDNHDWPTNLVTPYGTNRFKISDTVGSAIIPNGRAIEITEPDGGKQLYLFTNNAPGVPASYSAGQVPDLSPYTGTTLNNSRLDINNSFHWNKLQYSHLGGDFQATGDVAKLNAGDFLLARMKHWLAFGPGTNSVSEILSMQRDPSPDGSSEGQKVWFDYPGKTNSEYIGSQNLPLFVGQVLPDGTTRYTRTTRNTLGLPTQEVSTYTAPDGSPAYRTNTFTYAVNGIDLVTATNALGVQVSSNAYNTFHQVLTNFNAVGDATVFSYNANQQLSTIAKPSGLTTLNLYFPSGTDSNRLDRTIDVEISRTNAFTYYGNGLVFTHTDERGLTTTSFWDDLQRLTGVAYPDATGTSNLYTWLDLTATRDRLGHWSYTRFDGVRQKTAETNANSVVTGYAYCPCGALEYMTNAWNTAVQQVIWFGYDFQGNQIYRYSPDGYNVTNWYNPLRQLVATGDGAAYRWFFYNNQGLLTAVSNVFGVERSIVYDVLDRPLYVTEADGVTVTNLYDDLGRLGSRGYPDGGVETFGYSARGLTVYSNQLGLATFFAYDAAGRKTFETNANNELLRFTNSAAGDLLSLTDGRPQTTRWAYDIYGRATNKTDQAGTEILRYTYDPAGRMTNRWSAARGNTGYTFDNVGNLTFIGYASSPDVSFQYDPLNRLTNMVDAVGTNRYYYTSGNQLWVEDGPFASDSVTNTYQNRLRTGLALQQPAGAWTNGFGYDGAARLTNVVSQAGSSVYGFAAGAQNLVTSVALPNTAYITNTFDAVARLAGTYLKNSGNTVLNKHEYVSNTANQRTQQTRTDGSYVGYTYDNIGQLTVADSSVAGEDCGYRYDTGWNLRYLTNAGSLSTFTCDPKNELIWVNSSPLTYDGNGNLLTNSGVIYIYDDENRLVTVANPPLQSPGGGEIDVPSGPPGPDGPAPPPPSTGGWRSDFTYDGFGRLRIRQDGYSYTNGWYVTNITEYIYDGSRVIQERDGNNLPTVSYTRGRDLSGSLEGAGGIGGLLARSHGYSAGNWAVHNFYHADGGCNITCMVNEGQAVVASYRYDPFGNLVSSSGTLAGDNLYRFSSKEFHANSGMYIYLYRFYDPRLQRWINRDPVEEVGGINLYACAQNKPINQVDPLGLDPLDPLDALSSKELMRAIETLAKGLNKFPAGSPEFQAFYQQRTRYYAAYQRALAREAARRATAGRICRIGLRTGAVVAAAAVGTFTGYYIRNEVNQGFQNAGAVFFDWWYGNPFGTSAQKVPDGY